MSVKIIVGAQWGDEGKGKIVGVFIGTYSSIFVVSPIVVDWELRSQAKKSQALGKSGKPIPKRA